MVASDKCLCASHRQANKKPNPPNKAKEAPKTTSGRRADHFQIDVSAEVLSARAKRFSPDSNGIIPPVPKKRIAWSGGKMNSNKEEALQKFLARKSTPGKPDKEKSLSPTKRAEVMRLLKAREGSS
jgi:hypothetical protein